MMRAWGGRLSTLLSFAVLLVSQQAPAQDAIVATARAPGRDAAAETVMKVRAPFTVAAVGDIIEPQPILSADPDFRRLVEVIRAADVGFANMESSLVDFKTFQGAVAGTEAPFAVGLAIKAMGITLMNHANNHAFDGGVMGMLSTDAALDSIGIVHAGSGQNLQDARAARFVATSKGRVGLVGMFSVDDSSNYGPSYARTLATYRNGNLGGAPGVDPLHLTVFHVVSPEQLNSLENLGRSVQGHPGVPAAIRQAGADRLKFFEEWYQAGADAGSLHYEMDPGDEKNILDSIRNGKIYADFMIATIHAHQTTRFLRQGGSGPWEPAPVEQTKEAPDHVPADFLVKLAHDSIDNGADMFVSHGVHALSGIEIYKGKPIFYGLSHFVFQFGLQFGSGYDILANERAMSALENDAAQETVLTTSHFEDGKLREVRLYPVDLGGGRRPISQLGIPQTPAPADAQRILKALQEYSRPFATTIAIEGNVGVIRIGTDGKAK
jgi:poly-gamma-glutamate synthesis protein (capsule biosynthesis protein)